LSGFIQAASEEAGIFLCGISARFRAMAFPTFIFHPYLFLAAAFQYLEQTNVNPKQLRAIYL
jgi:acyl dehydratase